MFPIIFVVLFQLFRICKFANLKNETTVNETINETVSNCSNSSAIDFLQMEINLIDETIYLYQKKLETLKQLREKILDENGTVLNISEELVNEHFSKIESKTIEQIQQQNIPSSQKQFGNPFIVSQDLMQKQSIFMNKIIKKQYLQVNAYAKQMTFIQVRKLADQQNNEPTFSYLLVILTSNNSVLLYDSTATFLQQYNLTKNVLFLSTSPSIDEYSLYTLYDNYEVQTHNVKYQKANKSQNSTMQKQQNPTKFHYQIQWDISFDIKNYLAKNASITAYNVFMIRGTKYHLFGDSFGNIYVFHKNGTAKGSVEFSANESIILFLKHYSAIITISRRKIAFFNPVTLIMNTPLCENPTDDIIDAVVESANANIFYVLLKNLEILIYDAKPSQSQCKITLKMNSAYNREPVQNSLNNYKIISVKSSLLLHNQILNSFKIFNVTSLSNQEQTMMQTGFDIVLQKQKENFEIEYGFYKLSNTLFQMIVLETNKEKEISELAFYEIMTPQQASSDFFSNFRLPVLIIAIILAIGYQIWGRKSKPASNQPKFDFDEPPLLKQKKFN